uniref:Uncharacterized protein n=1 Tax=Anguilla anguilla TaxID=7936 RepID=A0A0E9WAH4_ANGAN
MLIGFIPTHYFKKKRRSKIFNRVLVPLG